jgi:glycosyltransferase involved in cell wall biosynthesis
MAVGRRSLGGVVVEQSLRDVGYVLPGPRDVALVETARPRWPPYRVVLAQNAWNVVDRPELMSRLEDYPVPQRFRFLARRAIAQLNLHRADVVVCLTEAMADLCRPFARRVLVAPVSVPVDFLDATDPGPALPPGTLLVPGTVAPYKNPAAALGVFLADRDELALESVLFAGGDDGSGCWSRVEEEARHHGIAVERRLLGRREMRSALRTASAVAVLSGMESLSFPLAEALLLNDTVTASRIPAHVEIARRLGREPRWADAAGGVASVLRTPVPAGSPIDAGALRAQWASLGHALGLASDVDQGRS